MIVLSPTAVAAIAVFAALWLVLGLWALMSGGRRSRLARAEAAAGARAAALVDDGPALPLIVHRDGSVEGGERLAGLLGTVPGRVEDVGLDGLAARAKEAGAGARFSLRFRPEGASSALLVRGGPAPPAFPRGSAILWFIDVTEAEDETDRLRGEAERVAEALEALTGLIEAAPFPMWHRGPDLRLAMVNSAYVLAVEAESASAVVENGMELVDEPDEERAPRHAASVREKGHAVSRIVPATIAGERRMMRVVEVPLGPAGVAGYAVDIDDLEQARAELARFVRAQRDMLDRLSAGVAQFAPDRGLAFFNQPFARLFGLRGDFLADRPEFNRVLDSMREGGNLPEARDYPEWKAEKGGWFTAGLAADEEEWLLPGGKHLRVVAQPLPDGGLLLIFEDRTEQIQLASARDTLLRVRSATFDNLFEAVGVFASDGRLHLWNNRFRELWRFDEEQLAGHPRVDALTAHIAAQLKNPNHAGLVRELVRSATQERKQRSGRVSLTDGREYEFAAVPLPDGNALFTMLDVTASRTVEAALRERTQALEEADRVKTAFVSNMSYELRTPLTSIGGFAEMLAAGYAGKIPAAASDYVAAILQSVARLGQLIDNVLDLTQSDVGSLLLAEEELDLAALCGESAEEATPRAEAKGLDFAVEIEPGVGSVTGDRRRLGQALSNLIDNAIAYTESGGRVLLNARGDDREAAITVSDNGRGIAPADQARVFDRFHRTAQAESGASVGLGLPLARQFVEAHGGRIELVSEPGEGTTVTIHLPRRAI